MKLYLNTVLFVFSILAKVKSAVTLSPEQLPAVVQDQEEGIIANTEEPINKDNKDWHILPDSSNLVCDKLTGEICHPLTFVPKAAWTEILPLQQLPIGLDIRMNLETGLKEAKLRDLNISQEELAEDEYDSLSELHEFTAMFESLKNNQGVVNTLEELIDFSHDYKHGSKIIQKEQNFIISKLKDSNTTDDVKDLYLRLLTSCLRNNPPAREIFFIKNVDFVVRSIADWVEQKKTLLLKRCVNILQNVAYKASPNVGLIDNLEMLYNQTTDVDLKIKILEIFSDLELLTEVEEDQASFYFNPQEKSIVKRNLDNKLNLESWFKEYCEKIQIDSLDELYLAKFLKTLVKFKELDSDLKTDEDFTKWIAQESMSRFSKLEDDKNNKLKSRDLEQELFDREFIRIRHEVFGNKMASRIKMPLDEL